MGRKRKRVTIDPVTGASVIRRIKLGGGSRRSGGLRFGHISQPKIFKCHLESCAKIFNDRASLKKHMTVHGDKLVSLNNLNLSSSSNAPLKPVIRDFLITLS